jgi:hypothetical protein
MTSDARTIYQDHIDAQSQALWTGDFAAVTRGWLYPHRSETRRHVQVVRDADELLETARLMRESMTRLGATAFHRVCLVAAFHPDDPERIDGRHRVFLLRGGSYAHPPFESWLTLRRRGGVWLSAAMRSENDITELTTLDPARVERLT